MMQDRYAWIPITVGLLITYVIQRPDATKKTALRRLLYWVGPAVICSLIGLIAHWSPMVSIAFGVWALMNSGLLYLGHEHSGEA